MADLSHLEPLCVTTHSWAPALLYTACLRSYAHILHNNVLHCKKKSCQHNASEGLFFEWKSTFSMRTGFTP